MWRNDRRRRSWRDHNDRLRDNGYMCPTNDSRCENFFHTTDNGCAEDNRGCGDRNHSIDDSFQKSGLFLYDDGLSMNRAECHEADCEGKD